MRILTTIIDDDWRFLDIIEREMNYYSSETDLQFNLRLCADPGLIQTFESDWYIIDVELNGKSGFEVAHKIQAENPYAKIIFCTAHPDLVFQSFQVNVFYFIRKDRLHEDLAECIKKYKDNMLGNYVIEKPGTVLPIPYERIAYFEVSGNDLFIHLADGEELQERKTMKKLVEEVPAKAYVSPSVHYLVNCSFILSIRDNELHLKNGKVIPIAVLKRKAVKDAYLKYLSHA